jgi:hypothetical protein
MFSFIFTLLKIKMLMLYDLKSKILSLVLMPVFILNARIIIIIFIKNNNQTYN